MNTLDFSDLGMDESPATIAYVLLSLTTAAFDTELVVEDDLFDEVVICRDRTSGFEYFRVRVSPMMGMLLISVLNQTGIEVSGLEVGDEPWISNN